MRRESGVHTTANPALASDDAWCDHVLCERMIKVCVGGILLRERTALLGKRCGERSFYPNVWDVFGGT